ncbi:hypothetical protein DICSQDRAFT_101752 [Dichomitus squalens LYAD-421 SS1]|uniref:uncharacterized protein n=1 Tax=Dichomitus squalens (strain LYAD-421) TaxID=732165 RepID=UPI0004411F12|nr:uncharacterized protein DICSQDRAFT_101752 [Dichomitus squalens LYAD-421 SS1]EJF63755.1 hypothetical protein DICSQDRAFT_101752 [Dichomitus squalens LYAD-421 SS1]
MTKPSLIPASAPTSPVVHRTKQHNHPSTPQRPLHHSLSARHFASPFTPVTTLSTPYTPLSLRSFSSNGSSIATPASAAAARRRNLSLSLSPEVHPNAHAAHNRSLADIASNWRTRANENGIKVAPGDESKFLTDDCSFAELSNSSIDESLLPAPFLSGQRRARALSHAPAPLVPVADNVQLATPNRSFRSVGILNTPPPQPGYRLRGSVTDPAHTRRRPAFEQTSELYDIDEDDYAPYPQTFSPPAHSQTLPLSLNDPFNTSNLSLSAISHISEPIQFYETPQYFPPPLPRKASASATTCSVCGLVKGSLAILKPCSHPLCSTCLTSALNIVGEKDMECAMCHAKVDAFTLCKDNPDVAAVKSPAESKLQRIIEECTEFEEFDSGIGLLPSNFNGREIGDVNLFDDDEIFMDRAQGASTPVAGSNASFTSAKTTDRVVLRIDNVPWDITPPAIAAWLKHPVERVHVLLDRKGKTLSHAFAEMVDEEAAKAALRTSQNSVLGKGKRARGVTVTRSSQEELMRALFPSWQGNFDGSRPSLAGLGNEHVISTLQRGLISETELTSLLHLIKSPDSHFLKVPSLPFYSLISILSKFPADDDSRVFWSGNIRDSLYEMTHAAVQTLMARIEENPLSDWATLLKQVIRVALDCRAFTSEQMGKLSDILEATAPQATSSPPQSPRSRGSANSSRLSNRSGRGAHSPSSLPTETLGNLAKEFGVDPLVVEALAQRLAGVH